MLVKGKSQLGPTNPVPLKLFYWNTRGLCDDQSEAANAIAALKDLSGYDLDLSLQKSHIISDRADIANVSDIGSIQVTDHFKCLGFSVFYDRQKILQTTKNALQRFM